MKVLMRAFGLTSLIIGSLLLNFIEKPTSPGYGAVDARLFYHAIQFFGYIAIAIGIGIFALANRLK